MDAVGRAEREGWKVTTEGQFVRFPGLTFISHLAGPLDGWERLLAALAADPVIAASYAMLPADSLHVTVKNHETAKAAAPSRDAWDMWLEAVLLGVAQPTSRLRAMMASCERHEYAPTARIPAQQTAWHASHSTLQLELRLDSDPEPLRSELTALGSRAEPGFVFHMTLAYRYGRTLGDAERDTLNARLRAAFASALAVGNAAPLQFKPCRLHYFPSMVKFVSLHNK